MNHYYDADRVTVCRVADLAPAERSNLVRLLAYVAQETAAYGVRYDWSAVDGDAEERRYQAACEAAKAADDRSEAVTPEVVGHTADGRLWATIAYVHPQEERPSRFGDMSGKTFLWTGTVDDDGTVSCWAN